MDAIDRKILAVVQEDASLSVAEIGQRVGLSSTPCWKRLQRLEADGVITRRVAIIDSEKVGLGITVFVSIETGDHSQEWLKQFADVVGAMPEVMTTTRVPASQCSANRSSPPRMSAARASVSIRMTFGVGELRKVSIAAPIPPIWILTCAFPRRRSSPAAWTAAALSTVSQKASTDMRGAGAICASAVALETGCAEVLSATAAC